MQKNVSKQWDMHYKSYHSTNHMCKPKTQNSTNKVITNKRNPGITSTTFLLAWEQSYLDFSASWHVNPGPVNNHWDPVCTRTAVISIKCKAISSIVAKVRGRKQFPQHLISEYQENFIPVNENFRPNNSEKFRTLMHRHRWQHLHKSIRKFPFWPRWCWCWDIFKVNCTH